MVAISSPARSAARDRRPEQHPPPPVGIRTPQGLTAAAGDLRSPLHEVTHPPPLRAQRIILFLTTVTVPAIAHHHHRRKLLLLCIHIKIGKEG